MVVDILHGSKSEKIQKLGLDTLSTYGIMADIPTARIRTIVDFLIENEYISLTNDEFSVIKLSPRSAEIIREKKQLEMKLPNKTKPDSIKKAIASINVNTGLFSALQALRKELAIKEHVPAYIIFSDAALHDMCRKLPVSKSEFLQISGVGNRKAEKYGNAFCALISKYLAEQKEIKKPDHQ